MKEITLTQVKKVAQRELLKEYGFNAPLKDISIQEYFSDGNITKVFFCINGKGYSWRAGENCYRNEIYDL